MKKVILFPGTDAIENESFRAEAQLLPGVLKRLREAEYIVLQTYGKSINLVDYMHAPNDLSAHGFKKLVLCSLATQVALYDNYVEENGAPDCVMGLSLGDVPRSVVSGLVTFEEGVRILYLFTSMHKLVKPGMSVHIRLQDTFDRSKTELKLEEYGIYQSVIQNEKYGLLAGSIHDMQSWVKEIARPQLLDVKPMYPFPLHTPLMKPIESALLPHIIKACNLNNKSIDVFSVVYGRFLKTKKETISDCLTNISSCLDFPSAIQNLVKEYEEVQFVSIGPSNSLLKFLDHMDLPSSVTTLDWFDECLNTSFI